MTGLLVISLPRWAVAR
ncbi:hypothetical protein, partial [Mesorhizobium sp.]